MKYSIIGSGAIGTALARAFARNSIDVAIANTRGPETLAFLREGLGPNVFPQPAQDAYGAEIIFLAVPFSAHRSVAKQLGHWNSKVVVDVTNAFHAASEELGDRLSSEIVSAAFVGARIVKAFNHLPAEQLGMSPSHEKQVIFVSSNDADAGAKVASVAIQLGFAPVELGRLDKGGAPLHVSGGIPGGLLFQNLVKAA